MPEFLFVLVKDGKQFPLAGAVELPDQDAARRHAGLAILKVFSQARNTDDWSGWQLCIRDGETGELDQVGIADMLTKLGWTSDGTSTSLKR